MNKEIRIINYVLKTQNKIDLISIERYYNYHHQPAKIKFLYGNEYLEKDVLVTDDDIGKLVFEDLIITNEFLEFTLGTHVVKLNIDNKELINEYKKSNVKNFYKSFDVDSFYGIIDGEEVSGKMLVDYEILKTIPDEYYKMYTIDFKEFNGSFNFLSHDKKGINVNLTYKDELFKNKKSLNVRKINFFKLSNLKLKCSGNYLWIINLKETKVFKSTPSIIPFRYIRGNLHLEMKKHLFKIDLDAFSKETLLITYQFN